MRRKETEWFVPSPIASKWWGQNSDTYLSKPSSYFSCILRRFIFIYSHWRILQLGKVCFITGRACDSLSLVPIVVVNSPLRCKPVFSVTVHKMYLGNALKNVISQVPLGRSIYESVILTCTQVILIGDLQKNGFKLLQSSNYIITSLLPRCLAEHPIHRRNPKFTLDECKSEVNECNSSMKWSKSSWTVIYS